MKKFFASIMVLSLMACAVNLSSQAATGEKERGYISLSTSANAEIAPDVAEIAFAIKTSDPKSLQKATTQNKEISDKVYSILKGMIDSTKGDYIKTSNFNAAPVYTYSGNKKNLDKYEVSNRVIVHTKSTDKIGNMIDQAISAGATNVDSLNFSVSNYESQCNSLIGQAAAKANTRANIAAKSMNAVLDGVRSMDVSCSENSNYSTPRMYMAKNMLGAVADGVAEESVSTSISTGVVKVYANINVSFFVK